VRNQLTLAGCCLFVAALAVQSCGADEPTPDKMTGREILDRMANVYARCRSYRDAGVVQTMFVQANGNRTVKRPFKTAFVRPDRFRFEYTEKQRVWENRFIVWQNGRDVRTWWSVRPGVEKPESLGLAIAGATGVSGGSAHTIPAQLLPTEIGGRQLTEMRDVKRAEDAKLDKVDCFRIEGKFVDSPMTVWIDSHTFLVRRIDSKTKFKKSVPRKRPPTTRSSTK
jgi:hypothetical protein